MPNKTDLAEFELDSDELDHTVPQPVNPPPSPGQHRDQSMPLLVGLLDSSARRSMEDDVPLHRNGTPGDDDFDLEEIAAKRLAGGGMIDSVANMANSILGAGNVPAMLNRVFAYSNCQGSLVVSFICYQLMENVYILCLLRSSICCQ